MDSNVQPIPLSDAVEAIVTTALRRAKRELRKADVGGSDALHSRTERTVVGDVDVRIDVTVRGPECDLDVPSLRAPHEWSAAPVPTRCDVPSADQDSTRAAELLAAHARVARRTLSEVEVTDVGTASWNALMYDRATLRGAMIALLAAIDKAQA